jgi:hypothetical protein
MTMGITSPTSTTGQILKDGTAVISFDANNNATFAGTVVSNTPLGMRNRIINGDMRIDQRNAGASVTPTTSQYTLDRWQAFLPEVASKFSVQQSSTAPNSFINSLLVTSTSAYSVGASERFGIRQMIEGLNVSDLAWGTANAQTVTLSFWVRSSLTGTFGGAISNNANDRSYPFSYTISTANTWEQKTITVAGDTTGTWLTTNGMGMRIIFGLGVGSTYSGTAGTWASANYASATGATSVVATNGATLYITGVQLEVGSTATPFERRMYGNELVLCQRYFCKTFSIDTAPANNAGSTGALKGATRHGSSSEPSANWKFPVSMRTNPTVTLYNTGSGTAGQWSADGTSTSSANARSQWIGTEGCAMDNTGNAFNNISNIQASATAEL